MKIKVTMKRSELQELVSLFEAVQCVTINEKDIRDEYMAFKLLMGMNLKTVFSLSEKIAMHLIEIQSKNFLSGKYEEFLLACDEYVTSNYAKRDKEGELVLDKDGGMELKSTPDLSPLAIEYKDAIDAFNKVNIKLKRYLSKKITFELEKIELDKIPVNLSGSYLNSIKCVLG